MWSKSLVALWMRDPRINHSPVTFGGHRPCRSQDIVFLIWYMTSYDHVIKRSYDLVGGPSLISPPCIMQFTSIELFFKNYFINANEYRIVGWENMNSIDNIVLKVLYITCNISSICKYLLFHLFLLSRNVQTSFFLFFYQVFD